MSFDLFDASPVALQGRSIPPQFQYIHTGMLREIQKVVAYYRNHVTQVDNRHLVVRILLSLAVSMRRDPQNYADVVSDFTAQLCGMLHITGSLNYGRVFSPGVFYGPNCTEIIVSDDTEFDAVQAARDWQQLKPIRVVRHPFTDLNYARCDGRYQSKETGVAVIAINIPMLAIQYREWFIQEYKRDPKGIHHRTHQFVSMFPLTNMLESHLDLCLFNRMSALYRGDDVAPYQKAHPFYVIDYTPKVDDVLQKELTILQRRPLTFGQIVESVPAISVPTLLDVMRLPSVIPTRQVKWALLIARLPLIRFLVQLNYDADNPKNQAYLNRLKIQLHAARTDRVLEAVLPNNIVMDIDDMIHRDIEAFI